MTHYHPWSTHTVPCIINSLLNNIINIQSHYLSRLSARDEHWLTVRGLQMRGPMGFMGRSFGGDLEQVGRICSLLLRSTGCHEPLPFSLFLAFLWFLSHANPLGVLGWVGQKSASWTTFHKVREAGCTFYSHFAPWEKSQTEKGLPWLRAGLNWGRCDKDKVKLFSLPCLPTSIQLFSKFCSTKVLELCQVYCWVFLKVLLSRGGC